MKAILLPLLFTAVAGGAPDIRVAKGLGSHGYNSLRISIINDDSAAADKSSWYNEPFRHRWTANKITSKLFTNITAGTNTIALPDGSSIRVTLPRKGNGIRALLFGDACSPKSSWGGCDMKDSNGNEYDATTVMPEVLNLVQNGSRPVDLWAMLGDNWCKFSFVKIYVGSDR